MNSLANGALERLRSGLSVIPAATDGSKRPLVAWSEFQERLPTEEEIGSWFKQWPDAGQALIAGKVSGNLEIIDFDDPGLFDPWTALVEEAGGHDLLRRLIYQRTPSGGCHAIFRCAEPVEGNQKLARCKGEDGRPKVQIETRGQGGYALVDPSPGYAITSGSFEGVVRITPAERRTLLDSARALSSYVEPARVVTGGTTASGGRPGDDFNLRATWAEILEPHGWSSSSRRGNVVFWRRPGKTDIGHSASENFADTGLLFVFSTNGDPFEEDRAYSKFAAYAILKHNGDFAAAAKELAAKGYGTPRREAQSSAPASSANKDEKRSAAREPSYADQLVALTKDLEVFHDEQGAAFVYIEANGHRECWRMGSEGFRRWLRRRFYESTNGKIPGSQAVQDALGVLEAKAQFDGPQRSVFLRVGTTGGDIWVDLGDEEWRGIHVTAEGWEVKPHAVAFRRPRGMLPLPEPERGGSIGELKDFLRAPNDDSFRIDVGSIVQAFRPRGPYLVDSQQGEQGSGKSLKTRVKKRIVDPAVTELRAPPRELRDLAVAARNSWLIAFDNLGSLSAWMSDGLCRLSTGGGFGTRELYSDDEEVVLDACRPLILNGIAGVVASPDLLDRCTLSTVPPFTAEDPPLPEAEFWTKFEVARPRILGAICDALVVGLRRGDSEGVSLHGVRMLDAAAFVEACAPAFGWKPGEFVSAYRANRGEASESVLEGEPVAEAILALVPDEGDEWVGSTTDLLKAIKGKVGEETTREKDFPKSAQGLGHRVTKIAPELRRQGIQVERDREENRSRRRTLTIRRVAAKIVQTRPLSKEPEPKAPPPQDHADNMDDLFGSHSCGGCGGVLGEGEGFICPECRAETA